MTPALHPAAIDPQQLLLACEVGRSRASGPGGQHRNKVETAIAITHRPTGVTGAAGERRSQHENHRVALFRLRVNLALQVRGYFDLRHVPSPLWQSRCSREGKLAVNPAHHDYPALLAEAMDVLEALRLDMNKTALLMGCTATQLVKLLKDEPRAMLWLNAQRQQRRLRPLR